MDDWLPILIAAMALLVLIRVERASRDIKALRTYVEQLRAVVDKIHAQVTPRQELRSEVEGLRLVEDKVRTTPRD